MRFSEYAVMYFETFLAAFSRRFFDFSINFLFTIANCIKSFNRNLFYLIIFSLIC